MNVVILGGTRNETYAFARQQGITGSRHIFSTSNLAGTRPIAIHTLPGYAGRVDRHAINAALLNVRRARFGRPLEETLWEFDTASGRFVVAGSIENEPFNRGGVVPEAPKAVVNDGPAQEVTGPPPAEPKIDNVAVSSGASDDFEDFLDGLGS